MSGFASSSPSSTTCKRRSRSNAPRSSACGARWQANLTSTPNIEEKIFYPQLLKRGTDDPAVETLDAIGDHNDIRDGVRDANSATVGSDPWWAAVRRTRQANDDH